MYMEQTTRRRNPLADAIRTEKEMQGLTYAGIANSFGKSEWTLRRRLDSPDGFGIDELGAIAVFLNVPLDELVTLWKDAA